MSFASEDGERSGEAGGAGEARGQDPGVEGTQLGGGAGSDGAGGAEGAEGAGGGEGNASMHASDLEGEDAGEDAEEGGEEGEEEPEEEPGEEDAADQEEQELDEAIRKRQEDMRSLEDDVKLLEENGRYLQAEKANARLQELQKQDAADRITRLTRRHQRAQDELKARRQEEEERRTASWRQKEQEATRQAQAARRACKARQEKEAEEELQRIKERQDAQGPRYSPSLLELRHKQSTLIIAKRYREAQTVKSQADKMQAAEDRKQQREFKANQEKAMEQLQKRHATEYSVLQRKLEASRKQLREEGELDRERVGNKYTNLEHDLVTRQKQEMSRLRRMAPGAPFDTDEEGNDIMATPAGPDFLYQYQKSRDSGLLRSSGAGGKASSSYVSEYIKGRLEVKPGESYYSASTASSRRKPAGQKSKKGASGKRGESRMESRAGERGEEQGEGSQAASRAGSQEGSRAGSREGSQAGSRRGSHRGSRRGSDAGEPREDYHDWNEDDEAPEAEGGPGARPGSRGAGQEGSQPQSDAFEGDGDQHGDLAL